MANIMSIDGIQTEARFDIAQRAYLMVKNCSRWGNERTVQTKRADSQTDGQAHLFQNVVSVNTTADTKRVKSRKTLIESPEWDAIKTLDGKVQNWLYLKGFVSDMEGILWIPKGIRPQVEARMLTYAAERAALVDTFVEAYPAQVLAAQAEDVGLGNLWNAADYPSAAEVRSRFRLRWRYGSFGVPDDLRLVSPADYQLEIQREAESARETMQDIVNAMRTSMARLVDQLTESLKPSADGQKKRFHGSNLANLQEFLSDFSMRNIAGDGQLAQLAERANALLSGVTVEGIKSNEDFRSRLTERMESLSSQLGELVENVPTRKFRKRGTGQAATVAESVGSVESVPEQSNTSAA